MALPLLSATFQRACGGSLDSKTTSQPLRAKFPRARCSPTATPVAHRKQRNWEAAHLEDPCKNVQWNGGCSELAAENPMAQALERSRGKVVPMVFWRGDGLPLRGWYYDAWRAACEKAGFPGRLVH